MRTMNDHDSEGATSTDWKEDPDEVLRSVDQQLEAFGLEVVMFETDDDSYVWRIEKRQPQS